jgi:hypothetical protein
VRIGSVRREPSRSSRGGEALRTVALFAGALLLLHHLEYAYGRLSPSEEAAAAHAHSYLSSAFVFVIVLSGFALLVFARDLVRARRFRAQPRDQGPPHLSWMWLQGSSLLLGSYLVQETVESLFAHEHVHVAGMLGERQGALTIILAAVLGGVVTLLRRGARAAIARLARPDWASALTRSPAVSSPSSRCMPLPRLLLLGSIAGRAPPHSTVGL